MVVGVAVFCAGSIICALAPTSAVLIAGRVVMGAGAAASEPGTLSMIRQIYPDARLRARSLGAWAAVSGLALALGPVLGGTLTGIWSWRAIFWFNVVFGGVAFVIARAALPESHDPARTRPDYVGFFLGAFALGSATFATIAGETSGYMSSGILTLYAVSVVSVITFFLVEARSSHPMLRVAIFARPAFTGANFIAMTSYFSVLSIFFFVALYLEIVTSAGAYQLAQDFLPLLGGHVRRVALQRPMGGRGGFAGADDRRAARSRRWASSSPTSWSGPTPGSPRWAGRWGSPASASGSSRSPSPRPP